MLLSVEGLEQHGVEVEIQRPDGHRAVVLCGATPLRDAHEQATGVVASLQNVTELHDLDRMKDEFVAIVSHELRTPLTAIRGSLQLLIADEAVSKEEDRELLDVSLDSCERLIRIVNDMLDLSKLEAGKLELHLTPTDVEDLIDRGVTAIATVARERGVTVAYSVPRSLPRVRGDVDRLTQVLVNLLSNAIRFAPTGSTVTVSAEAREGTSSSVSPIRG